MRVTAKSPVTARSHTLQRVKNHNDNHWNKKITKTPVEYHDNIWQFVWLTWWQCQCHLFCIRVSAQSDVKVKNMSEIINVPWRVLQVQMERKRGYFQMDPTFPPSGRCVGQPYPWSWPLAEDPHHPLCPPPEAYWTESPQCCENTQTISGAGNVLQITTCKGMTDI